MASWNDRQLSTSVSVRHSESATGRPHVVAAAFLLAFSWWGASAGQTQLLDRILAIVDGDVIMRSDVRAFIELGLVDSPVGSDTEAEALTYLIERRLMLNEVNRFMVAEPDAAVVDQRYDTVRQSFRSETELDRVLDRNGFSAKDLRQVLVDEVRREGYVFDRFSAIDTELRDQAHAAWVSGLVDRARIRRVP